MAHKQFEITPTAADPPTFSVAGREFKCLAEPPSGVLMDVAVAAGGAVTAQAAGLIGFIEGCMPDVEADQFLITIHDKDTIVPIETLAEIVEWLVSEYTGRPTTPSSSSQPGSAPTAATSEDGAVSIVSSPPDSGSSD